MVHFSISAEKTHGALVSPPPPNKPCALYLWSTAWHVMWGCWLLDDFWGPCPTPTCSHSAGLAEHSAKGVTGSSNGSVQIQCASMQGLDLQIWPLCDKGIFTEGSYSRGEEVTYAQSNFLWSYMAKEKYLRDKVSMSGNLQHHFKRCLLAKKTMLPTCFGFWG